MSQIRIAKAGDVGAFPGSAFVVDGSPPIAQCQETEIASATGISQAGSPILTDVGEFVGIDLTNKQIEIFNPLPNRLTANILSNTDDTVTLDTNIPAADPVNDYAIRDPGQTYLTRNQSSFQRFIEDQAKAHTTKGGQLFTDLADPPMDDACSDTWNPE